VDNVCEVLVTGEMYTSDVLKRAAVCFIRRNANEVMGTAVWGQFKRDQPLLVDYVIASMASMLSGTPSQQ
jgi:hypothetical protein